MTSAVPRRSYKPLLSRLWKPMLLLVLLAASVLAWSRFHHTSSTVNLPTATARQESFPVIVQCRGSLIAAHKVSLEAPLDVPDLQIIWLAPSGAPVKAGDVVIRFDASKLKQDRIEKTQALKQAQATLDQTILQARIDAGKDDLDLTSARADSDKAGLEASKKAIVSSIQGEESAIDAKTAQEKVKVQLSAAALHKESNNAKIASQTRLRDQAKLELDLVNRRLSHMEIASPIAGVVAYQTNTSQGWMNAQNFKVGDHAYPGATIAEIPDLTSLQMESKLNEEDRGRIAVGDPVSIDVDAFPEKKIHARLIYISPLTEQSFDEWPPVRTFRAFAAIDHPDNRLRPGMNAASGIVERTLPSAISVPSHALFTVDGKPAVYLQTNRGFTPSVVKVLARNPDEVAIEGIQNGAVLALVKPPAS